MSETNDIEESKYGKTGLPVEPLLLRRWSPRAFTDKAVSEDDLQTIFVAASWAASSYNEQPWRFIVGRKGDEAYKKIMDALVPLNQSWAGAAPVLYAAVAKKTFTHSNSPNGFAKHDVGAASANASLQAAALGLHTHGMGGFDSEKLQEAFHIPDGFEPAAVWALGYLGDPDTLPENLKGIETNPRERKPLGAFVFAEWEKPAF